VAWEALFHSLSFCLRIILETLGLIARYSWVNQGTVIQRLNKLLTSLQSESNLFIGQTVWINPAQIFGVPRTSTKIASRLQPPAHSGSSLVDFSTLKMEAIRSSEMSVHPRSTWHHIPEDGILHVPTCFQMCVMDSVQEFNVKPCSIPNMQRSKQNSILLTACMFVCWAHSLTMKMQAGYSSKNTGKLLPDYVIPHLRRQYSSG
jgi:hypothetical protein